MRYLTSEETNILLGEAKTDAFHLEVSDDHAQVSDESEPMRRVLAGLPLFDDGVYPPSWQAWDDLVTSITGKGVTIRRVRIITEPLTDYVRFLHTTTDRNVALGEDIRWLPRQQINSGDYTTDEWWLIDDQKVAFTIFGTDGDFAGAAVTTDPKIVERCVSVRDTVWNKAIPHDEYVPGHSG